MQTSKYYPNRFPKWENFFKSGDTPFRVALSTFRRIIPFIILCQFVISTQANASGNVDLDLARRLEQSAIKVEKISNPHEMECTECHVQLGKGRFLQYLVDDDTISLCLECHTPSHLHPVGVPASSDTDVLLQIWLPLGKGTLGDQVICLSCHYMHSDEYRPFLLRGDTEKKKTRQNNLCSACHKGSMYTRSPHDETSESCTFCHTSRPEEGQKLSEILNSNVQASCDFCHDALGNGHYLAVNPFGDPDKTWDFEALGIPLIQGRFTCVSCHDPHDTANRKKKMLRPVYLSLAIASDRINPHWKNVMCISCHFGDPVDGNPMLLTGSDRSAVCDRCHNGRFARRDIHPVGMVPSSNVVIPLEMPLTEGKVTCVTCHDSSLQEGGEGKFSVGKVNPDFLRGGYTVRNEFCFRCHKAEQFGKLNAHLQLDEWGIVRPQSCLFCHTSLPNQQVLGIESAGFKDESIDEYCTCCHEGLEIGHPVGGDHLVEPSEEMLAVIEGAVEKIGVKLPLYNNRVTCATCHNPHEAGVIEHKTAAKGTGNKKRLRLSGGNMMMICLGCHKGM
jgi:hypothetical protein